MLARLHYKDGFNEHISKIFTICFSYRIYNEGRLDISKCSLPERLVKFSQDMFHEPRSLLLFAPFAIMLPP